jgi:hypothetical protein
MRLLVAAGLLTAFFSGLAIGWLIASQQATDSVEADERSLISIAFGDNQIWTPPAEVLAELSVSCPPRMEDWHACVAEGMERHGASFDAIQFFHLTEHFLAELHGAGRVKVGVFHSVWGGTGVAKFALLGGYPPVVYPNDTPSPPILANSRFRALLETYPRLGVNTGFGNIRYEQEVTAEKGQTFIVRYPLTDGGCSGCPLIGWARVAYDFSREGKLDRSDASPRLIEIVEP